MKKTTKTAPKKTAKAKAAPKSAAKKLSAFNAAAKVLADAKEPMACKELIMAMEKKGLWTSPGGKTPHATLYSAILREINAKGKEARFKKTDRGYFALNAAAKVLADAKAPMACKELIEAMEKKGLWTSPGGKTPAATLYSAILREIYAKGKEARFKKTDRGHFAINA